MVKEGDKRSNVDFWIKKQTDRSAKLRARSDKWTKCSMLRDDNMRVIVKQNNEEMGQ